MSAESNEQVKQSQADTGDSVALDWGFLVRTARATLVTGAIISLFVSVYYSPLVGGRYLVFATWSIFFFAMTALIIKYIMFEGKPATGMLYVVLKILSLAAMVAVNMVYWPMADAAGAIDRPAFMAMIAGIATPFGVLVLRAFSLLLDAERKGKRFQLPGMPQAQSTTFKSQAGKTN